MTCRVVDLPEVGQVIVCGRGRQGREKCQEPECKRAAVALCDWPLGGPLSGKTCDRRLCEKHRQLQGEDKDLCPGHARSGALPGGAWSETYLIYQPPSPRVLMSTNSRVVATRFARALSMNDRVVWTEMYAVYKPPKEKPILWTSCHNKAVRLAGAEGHVVETRHARGFVAASVLGVGAGRARWAHFSRGRLVEVAAEGPVDIVAAWIARACQAHGATLLSALDRARWADAIEFAFGRAVEATAHHCHAERCQVEVPPRMMMCRRHWAMVPRVLQRAVWATYRPGQERDKRPSAAYMVAQCLAREAVARREGLVEDAERCAARAARWRRRALDDGEELPRALAGDIQAADDPQEPEQMALFGEAQ